MKVSGNVFDYDSRVFSYDFEAIEAPYLGYLTKSGKVKDLYTAIHVDKSTKSPVFEKASAAVAKAYQSDNLVDYSSYYNYLLKEKHPYIVMGGEFDMRDGAAGQHIWMKELLNVSKNFWKQDRKIYYYQGDEDVTNVGGYYTREGEFTLLTVPKAGHFIPQDNYLASKAFLDDYVQHGSLQCRDKDSQCSVAKDMCTAMNQCSTHGQCGANGQCQCHTNYKGADCSYEAYNVPNGGSGLF